VGLMPESDSAATTTCDIHPRAVVLRMTRCKGIGPIRTTTVTLQRHPVRGDLPNGFR
jgi:hypothetical protein